ncbi:hypothetical protein KSS87_021313 [Heliosperma pusillum]|nr:hypothetical protein KSS87_021313 [Heliosperma pusillum]
MLSSVELTSIDNTKLDKYVRFEDRDSEGSTSSEQPLFPNEGPSLSPSPSPSPSPTPSPSLFSENKATCSSALDAIRRGVQRSSRGIRNLKGSLSIESFHYQSGKKSGYQTEILDPQGPFLRKWNKIFLISCVFAMAWDPLFLYVPVVDGKNTCLKLDYKLEIIACVLRTITDLFYLLHIVLQFRTGFISPSSRVLGRGELIRDPAAIARRYLSSYFIVDVLAVLPFPQLAVSVIIPNMSGGRMTSKGLLKLVIFTQYFPRLFRIYPLYKGVTRTSGIITETAWAGAAFNLFLYMLASHITNSTTFNFGMVYDALQLEVVQSGDFFKKLFYCFWWGLRNLRVEEMRVRRRDAEQWMSHRLLPEDLRERIRRYEQYKWQETRGVDEEFVVHNLPKDLRRDIKRHLCLALIKKVPMLWKMDERLKDAVCDRLKPVLYTEKSYVVREGDPVNEMLFIMRGKLLTMTTNGGRTGFFNSLYLDPGDFCGEELLTWALDPHSSSNLPISTRTVQSQTDVEAFALMPDDLKSSSHQWRLWAAGFIQAAWRRYSRRKLEKSLEAEEDGLPREGGSSPPSLGATILVSRFAANVLRNLRRKSPPNARIPTPRSPLLSLPKPAEPDFTSEDG